MNCDRHCKYYCQIEELREKCLKCRVCSDGNTIQANGRGVVHMDGAESAQGVLNHADRLSPIRASYEQDFDFDEQKPEKVHNVTALPPEIEEKLHFLMANFFSLKPIEVLLLWHLANGGNLVTFKKQTLDKTIKHINSFQHFDKRNAFQLLKRITTVFAPFKALAGGLIGKGKGGGSLPRRRSNIEQLEFDL